MEDNKACLGCNQPVVGRRRNALYCSVACSQVTRGARYYYADLERQRARRHAANRDLPARMLSKAKCRAKEACLPFNLEASDIVVPAICPVLAIPLVVANRGRSGGTDASPSLDRIEPLLGYVKGNVRVISNRANLLKSNATELEMSAVLADLRRLRRKASPIR